ncbi:hypothetical protein M9Y10_040315 [Tritrichomonas musculus]|uniref:Protein kinase domain-containing protein n=1 Tax=Tritrichomonas musculus TaxID=1915356 RepID=A0ABR2GPR2_9EUKA
MEGINIANYEFYSFIDREPFMTKYKVRDITTGNEFLAQIYNKSSKWPQIPMIEEIQRIVQFSHQSIIKIIGYNRFDQKHDKKLTLITEYYDQGSLKNILNLEQQGISPIDWDDTKKLINIYGIASGMSYLHSHGIVHRILNPLNIFEDENFYPKIYNFVFSSHRFEKISQKKLFSNVEDNIYLAPEILQGNYHYDKSDIYSFGMIVYLIISGKKPSAEINDLHSIIAGSRPNMTSDIPKCYSKLISKCWSQDPSKRPSFNQIINELKNNLGFITDSIDRDEFIEYVKNSQSKLTE